MSVALRGAELIRSGGGETVTCDVEQVLGRAARSFREWARDFFG
ncbi:MAG TPA: hypothetical protein VG497_25510 [Kribbella sp.]|nr:hypothetical protein [Kribbella sp.]